MDNSTGRFISSDPIKDGYNWYSYTAGNPISYVDPTGLNNVLHIFPYDPTFDNTGNEEGREPDHVVKSLMDSSTSGGGCPRAPHSGPCVNDDSNNVQSPHRDRSGPSYPGGVAFKQGQAKANKEHRDAQVKVQEFSGYDQREELDFELQMGEIIDPGPIVNEAPKTFVINTGDQFAGSNEPVDIPLVGGFLDVLKNDLDQAKDLMMESKTGKILAFFHPKLRVYHKYDSTVNKDWTALIDVYYRRIKNSPVSVMSRAEIRVNPDVKRWDLKDKALIMAHELGHLIPYNFKISLGEPEIPNDIKLFGTVTPGDILSEYLAIRAQVMVAQEMFKKTGDKKWAHALYRTLPTERLKKMLIKNFAWNKSYGEQNSDLLRDILIEVIRYTPIVKANPPR